MKDNEKREESVCLLNDKGEIIESEMEVIEHLYGLVLVVKLNMMWRKNVLIMV